MNKYLLLRDNKQSGPFTVPEIVAKGLKPYDLVWMEGKSAAWRYPSEIEELKEYAPAIEEQPYERFYKKPETAAKENKPEKKASFEPVIMEEPVMKKADSSSKKVYINFPGAIQRTAPIIIEKKEVAEVKKEVIAPVQAAPVFPDKTHPVFEEAPATAVSISGEKPSNRRMFYGIAAACFILILIVSILIINSGNQRSSIKKLNEMVQQMEKKQSEQNQAAKAALASRVIPYAPVADEPSAPVDESITSSGPEKKISAGNVKTSPLILPADPMTALVKTGKDEKPAGAGTAKESKIIAPPVSEKKSLNEDLYNQVSIKANKYKTGIFGGISGLQFVLVNNSPRELQKVAVEVQYFGPEKKYLKTQTVYFENVAPGAQPVIDVPKSARGVNISYKITDIKS